MALTSDSIKNPLNKIIVFVKLYYIEDNTLKHFLFSDHYKKFSNGDSPEVRLDSIPFFKKEIDPLTNAVIVQSSYKINLLNTDGVLTSVFNGKIFNSQKVEFYLSTEDSSDEILIASAICDDALVSDKIEINLKEITDLTKKKALNVFNLEADDITNKDLVDTKKQVVLGEVKVELENTNPMSSSDWQEIGLQGYIIRQEGTNYFRLVMDDSTGFASDIHSEKFQKLRKSLFEGDMITIKGYEKDYEFSIASSLYYPESVIIPGGDNYSYINLQIEKGNETNFYAFTGEDELDPDFPNKAGVVKLEGDILIQSSDSVLFNDEFHVSDKQTSTYEETNAVSTADYTYKNILKNSDTDYNNVLNQNHGIIEYNADTNFIETSDSWDFLTSGDRVQVLLQKLISGVWYDYTEEEVVVDSYNSTTKKIYFKEPDRLSSKVLDAVSNSLSNFRVKLRYNKIQKINIKDIDLELNKNQFDIAISPSQFSKLETYPQQINSYDSDLINYNPSDAGVWSILPHLQVRLKKNANHILANLAQVTRGQATSAFINYSDLSTIMNFAVGTFQTEDTYAGTGNARIEFIHGNSEEGDWKRSDQNQYNKSFWLIRIRSGVATYSDISNLQYDQNCPFQFIVTGGHGSTVVNFDSRINSVNTAHGSTYVNINSGDMSKYDGGDEITIMNADKSAFAYTVVRSKDTGTNRLYFKDLGFTPANNCVITKRFINDRSTTERTGVIGTVTASGAFYLITLSPTDFAKFSVGDTLLLRDGSNFGYTTIGGTFGSYTFVIGTMPWGAITAGATVEKIIRDLNESSQISGSVASGSDGVTLALSVADFIKFKVGDTVIIMDGNNSCYTTLAGVYTNTTKYVIPAVGFTPTTGARVELRKTKDYCSKRHFKIPGFFSVDVNVRTSLFNYNNLNSSVDKSATQNSVERFAERLIRKQNEKHKVIFTWYMEKDEPAFNEDLAEYHEDVLGQAFSPDIYLSESYLFLQKTNLADNQNYPRIGRYATILNICPPFSIEHDPADGKGWGGVNVIDPVDDSIEYGYVGTPTTDEKHQALAMAIANKINQDIERYFWHQFSTYKMLPIVAIPVRIASGQWVVRVKHCSFNSCPKVNTELWDTTNNPLLPAQAKQNFGIFLPFIKNNSLYLKLDRKALTMAYSVGVTESFRLLNTNTAENWEYIDNSFYLNFALRNSLSNAFKYGNGMKNWTMWPGSSSFNDVMDKNPSVLANIYRNRNRGNLFTYTIPNRYSRDIGSRDFEKMADPGRFSIVQTNSPVFPDISLVLTEKLLSTYSYKSTAIDDADWNKADNQAIYFSPDNYYQLTNWDIDNAQPAYEKKEFYPNLNGSAAHFGNTIYEWLELSSSEKIVAYYKDKQSNLASILEKILEVYGITNFSQSSLDTIRGLGIKCFLLLKEDIEFYKAIQKFLEVNNIVCFVDKNNHLVFEKLKLTSSSPIKTLSYFDCVDLIKKIDFPDYTSISIKYGQNNPDNKTLTQDILNPDKSATFEDFEISNVKNIESYTMNAVSGDNVDMLVQKYTEQNEYIEASLPMEHYDLTLNSVIKVEFKDDTFGYYLVCKVETDFGLVRIKAIKCI